MTAADIIAAIDEVTAPQCGWCNNALREDGPSPYFCNEEHAWAWNKNKKAIRPASSRQPGQLVNVAGEVYFGQPGAWTHLGTANVSFEWQPPADVVEARMERPHCDELWSGFAPLAVTAGPTQWFLRGADGHEVRVPDDVVAEATPLLFTRRDGLSKQGEIREGLRQLAQQFADAADRIRARRLPL